jgi:excinuclease UvrABC nuclease subunit
MRRPPKLPLEDTALEDVPEKEGVYQLLDEKEQVLRIAGTPDLRQALRAARAEVPPARFFQYETTHMYTMRESELLQLFLRRRHRLPEYNGVEEDLF